MKHMQQILIWNCYDRSYKKFEGIIQYQMSYSQKKIQLQDKKSQDNTSQSSRRQYKRFQPKQASETSSTKKKLQLNHQIPKNLVFVKSSSIQRKNPNQLSTPNLGLARTNSQTLQRKKTQQVKIERPPLPKQVRFTFGNPPEMQRASAAFGNAFGAQQKESSDVMSYQSLVDQFKTNGLMDSMAEEKREDPEKAGREQILDKEIRRYKGIREMYEKRMGEVRELYLQMSYFVKEQFVRYQIEVASLIKSFKIQLDQQLKLLQRKIDNKPTLDLKSYTSIENNPPNITNVATPVEKKTINIPTRLDHTNIMGKLDRIKLKLNEMTKVKEQFYDEQNVSIQANVQEKSSYFIKPPIDSKGRVLNYSKTIMQEP